MPFVGERTRRPRSADCRATAARSRDDTRLSSASARATTSEFCRLNSSSSSASASCRHFAIADRVARPRIADCTLVAAAASSRAHRRRLLRLVSDGAPVGGARAVRVASDPSRIRALRQRRRLRSVRLGLRLRRLGRRVVCVLTEHVRRLVRLPRDFARRRLLRRRRGRRVLRLRAKEPIEERRRRRRRHHRLRLRHRPPSAPRAAAASHSPKSPPLVELAITDEWRRGGACGGASSA